MELFFIQTVDDFWTSLGNWFEDSSGTIPASTLPGVADSVVVQSGQSTVDDLFEIAAISFASIGISINSELIVNSTVNTNYFILGGGVLTINGDFSASATTINATVVASGNASIYGCDGSGSISGAVVGLYGSSSATFFSLTGGTILIDGATDVALGPVTASVSITLSGGISGAGSFNAPEIFLSGVVSSQGAFYFTGTVRVATGATVYGDLNISGDVHLDAASLQGAGTLTPNGAVVSGKVYLNNNSFVSILQVTVTSGYVFKDIASIDRTLVEAMIEAGQTTPGQPPKFPFADVLGTGFMQ